jgi:hypothetical protein
MEVSALACFYSENLTPVSSNARESALEFHHVVNSLFQKRDIIPFRFPTLLADETEVAAEIEQHAAEYHDDLDKVRGRVQLDIRIRLHGEEQPEACTATNSGAEYLRARHQTRTHLRSAAEALRTAAGDLIERWREREYSGHLRCFALIARDSFGAVQAALAAAAISSDLLAHVSGPWPATAFLKEDR